MTGAPHNYPRQQKPPTYFPGVLSALGGYLSISSRGYPGFLFFPEASETTRIEQNFENMVIDSTLVNGVREVS